MNLEHAQEEILGENYLLTEKVGEGGYGLVYKAKQQSTGQTVAVKTLKPLLGVDEKKSQQQIARFEREAKLCGEISHPNIVKLIDKGYDEEKLPYAVFEYVPGQTLKELILSKRDIPFQEFKHIMEQVLSALVCAHEHGIIHRDLKPQNIMVFEAGGKRHAKVLDFGIGAFTNDFAAVDHTQLTMTHEVMGTPRYSAPEQLRGEPPTEKSDIYAWGLMLVECMTGEPAIKGQSVAEVFQYQLMPTEVNLPAFIYGHSLGNLLQRVLKKNPQQRIANAQQVLEELEKINFNTLHIPAKKAKEAIDEDVTVANSLSARTTAASRKQITVLCIKLNIVPIKETSLDLETLDALEKDQLNLCKDTILKYGGNIVGTVSNHVLAYFGYPETYDTDARRAGQSALELISEGKRRSGLLENMHGTSLDLRATIHSGKVLAFPNQIPEGNVPSTAFELLYKTFPMSVQVSEPAKKLLEPYLTFSAPQEVDFSSYNRSVRGYYLVGGRLTETTSGLRSQSAQRPMAGREQEKETLLTYWKASAEKGQAVQLKGQAGIGKSRLTYEVKKVILENGNLVKECRCLPEHQNSALYPIFNMFRKQWGIDNIEDHKGKYEKLNSVLSGFEEREEKLSLLCSWLDIVLEEDTGTLRQKPPEEQKQILFEVLKTCLFEAGSDKPFLLVMEDLHWADPTTKEFLSFILQDIAQYRCLLLTTTRPVAQTETALLDINTIELMQLSNDDASSIIGAILNGKPIAEVAMKYIIERTDGIPLYVEELTSMLLDEQYLTLQDEVFQLVADIEDKPIPNTLQDLLNARLDRLEGAKETAQVAATIGREFDYDLLVRSSAKEEALVEGDLQQLIAADLVYQQEQQHGEKYLFRHALISDAAYEGMTNTFRKELHGKVAETLEKDFPQRVEENPFEVGRHWAASEAFGEAVHYGLNALEKQVRNQAGTEPMTTKNVLMDWIAKVIDEGKKIEFELRLNEMILPVEMAKSGYGSREVQEINKRNEFLIRKAEEENRMISNEVLSSISHKIEWGLFLNYHFCSQRQDAAKMANNILERLTKRPDRDKEVGMLVMLSQSFHADGDLDKAEELSLRLLDIYNEDTDVEIGRASNMEPKSVAHFIISHVYLYQGKVETGLKHVMASIEWAEHLQNPVSLALAYTYYTFLAYMEGDKEEFKRIYKKYTSHQLYNPNDDWTTVHMKMLADWANETTEYAEQYVKNILASNQHYALAWYEPSLAETYRHLGQVDKAIELMENALNRICNNDELWGRPFVRKVLALCYHQKDKKVSERVRKELDQAKMDARKMGALWYDLEAQVIYLELLGEEKGPLEVALLNELKTTLSLFVEGRDTKLFKRANKLI